MDLKLRENRYSRVSLVRATGLFAVLAVALSIGGAHAEWIAEAPCLEPGPPGAHDETSVKDPSIVFADGRYHLFYSARGDHRYSLAYVSAPSIDALKDAPRFPLTTLSEATGYACASQVFYFEPQERWYLIYQNHGLPYNMGRYTPMFVTTSDLSDPTSWSKPQKLVEKFEKDKWIDFWVICDEEHAYLFYTRNHTTMYYMKTPLDEFPNGFADPTAIENVEVHEAVCVYHVEDTDSYAMLVELNYDGRRSYALSTAPHLEGPWTEIVPFADGKRLVFPEGVEPWTNMVSHGELLRSGHDQRLQIRSLDQAQFLIQGTTTYFDAPEYAEIIWRLGVIDRNPGKEE